MEIVGVHHTMQIGRFWLILGREKWVVVVARHDAKVVMS